MKITEEIIHNKRNILKLILLCGCIGVTSLVFYESKGAMEPVHMAVMAVFLYIGSINIYRKKQLLKGKRVAAGISLLTFSLAMMTLIGGKISLSERVFERIRSSDIVWIFLYCVIYGILFSNLLLLVKNSIVKNHIIRKTEVITDKTTCGITRPYSLWLIYGGVLMLFWLPVFFIYFPGIVADDSTISIAMYLKEMSWDNHFPVFYSLILGTFVKLGEILGNTNIGVAMYSFLQLVVMAAGLGHFLVWMRLKGINKIYVYGAIAFFASAPLFGNYAIVMWKDPIFSLLLLLMVLFLYDHVASNKESFLERKCIIQYICLSVGICLMRNNGVYVVGLISVVLMGIYWQQWKRALIACSSGILISLIITGPVYQNVFSAENLFVESIGIPLQQMVRVVVMEGKMTEAQEEYMDNLLPMEEYVEVYNPYLVDPVKWAPDFDNEFLESNKTAFFQTWLGMLGPNFKIYTESYLMETLSFWRIGEEIPYELVKTNITGNGWGIYSYMPVENLTGYQITEVLNQKYDFIPTAVPIWIVFINMLFCVVMKKLRYIVPLLPLTGTWLTMMVATPTAFGLRYVFVYVLALPLALIYMWMVKIE
jgi:hypothetical protein